MTRLFLICPKCLERYESNTLKLCLADRTPLVVTTTPKGIALVASRKARGMSGGKTRTRAIRRPTPLRYRDHDSATLGRL